jgi:hypothetical protein
METPTMGDSPPPASPARPGAITVLLLVAGLILLLPGLCAVVSAVAFSFTLQELSNSPWSFCCGSPVSRQRLAVSP